MTPKTFFHVKYLSPPGKARTFLNVSNSSSSFLSERYFFSNVPHTLIQNVLYFSLTFTESLKPLPLWWEKYQEQISYACRRIKILTPLLRSPQPCSRRLEKNFSPQTNEWAGCYASNLCPFFVCAAEADRKRENYPDIFSDRGFKLDFEGETIQSEWPQCLVQSVGYPASIQRQEGSQSPCSVAELFIWNISIQDHVPLSPPSLNCWIYLTENWLILRKIGMEFTCIFCVQK